MRMKLQLRFSSDEAREVNEMARLTGLTTEEFCRKAIFYAMMDAYRRTEDANRNHTESGITGGNTPEVSSSGSTSSNALSDTQDAPVTTQE